MIARRSTTSGDVYLWPVRELYLSEARERAEIRDDGKFLTSYVTTDMFAGFHRRFQPSTQIAPREIRATVPSPNIASAQFKCHLLITRTFAQFHTISYLERGMHKSALRCE
jgi:hypothetical protein